MKNKIKYMSKAALSTVLSLCMLISCLSVGLISTDAAYVNNMPVAEKAADDTVVADTETADNNIIAKAENEEEPLGANIDDEAVGNGRNWYGKIYFRAPDSWDLSTNSHVQVWAVQSESASSGTKYAFLMGSMTVVGSTDYSRLYSATLSTNHSDWGNSEYIAFTANTSDWNTGDFYISTCTHYTKPYNYSVANDSGAYIFYPSNSSNNTATNNNTMSGTYDGTEANAMRYNTGTQKAYAYTNSSSSSNGGTVSLSAYYLNESTAPAISTISNTTTATFDKSVQGTKVTMTATAKSGYYFAGWYDSSSFSTKITSDTEYVYYAYESKSYYARFLPAHTVTVNAGTGGSVESSTVAAVPGVATTLPTATPAFGYKFKNWTTSSSSITISNDTSASAATVTATGAGTVTANFEADMSMNIYIVGRFRYRTTDGGSTWTYTKAESDGWDASSTNIKMTATSTDFLYKLETNASLAELSANIYNITPYFHIKSGDSVLYPSANTAMSTSGTVLSTTNSNTCNLYFNSSSYYTPVTIYFRTDTGKIWYETPTYYNITCNTATGGTVSADPAKQKSGAKVTLNFTPSTGYQVSSVSVKQGSTSISVSGTGNSRNFTMPAGDVTVTPSFSKINYTLTKASTSNGSFTLSPSSSANYQDEVTVTCSPNTDYELDSITTSPSTTVAINGNTGTFSMPASNTTVTVTFKEKLHDITVQTNNSSQGTVLRGSTTVSGNTTKIGNVTAVTLAASNETGYEFDHWTVKKDTATSMTVNGTTQTLSSTSEITIPGSASSSFKFNGTATLKAYFKPTDYSLSAVFSHNNTAAWNSNSVTTTDTNANAKQSVNLNDLFDVRVTLADGYDISSVTFESTTGYVSATQQGDSTTSGSVVIYHYKATTAGQIKAKVTLKAKTPTINSVKIRNKNQLVTQWTNVTSYANNSTVDVFYKQPVNVIATTDTFSKLGYQVFKADGTTVNDNATNKDSGAEISLNPDLSIIPQTETGSVTYLFKVTATNAPAGVTAVTTTYKYTMNVTFNENQKVYFRLNKLHERCIKEDVSSNPYYGAGAPISAYNAVYDQAKAYINSGYPDYLADTEQINKSTADALYDSFRNAYRSLRQSANTTTVYILTKIQNNANSPMYMHVWGNGSDWNHFKMFNCADALDDYTYINEDTIKMSYAGKFKYSGVDKYLYKITYTGHINFEVWCGSSSTDTQKDTEDALTNSINNATAFKEYYINAHNTSRGTATINSVVEYVDFGHTKSNNKALLEIGDVKTGAQIKQLLEITPVSSLITAPGITVTNDTFTITGPVGKAGVSTKTVDLLKYDFEATTQGRYTVTYVTNYGKNANNGNILKTCEATIYVAFDEVSIYVDMNENVGNPILNFKYLADSSGKPVETGGNVTQLPYEMDLVTGSESIYKFTISISKLDKDYKIKFNNNNPIKISYITIENYFVNTNGKTTTRPTETAIDNYAFEIGIDARVTGEVWLKADSTNLKTFNQISYGSVNKTFVAVLQDGNNTVLSSPFNSVHGTGINSDIDDMVYNSQYAAQYTLDGQNAPIKKFGYVLKTSAKAEIAGSENTKYYFDKWIAMRTPASGIVVNDNGKLSTNYSAATDFSSNSDLNFTSAVDYNNGECDITYIALYKTATTGDSTVRVEVTYNFKDFDTSDGNYIYQEGKTVNASYTKTIKVKLNELYSPTNMTYGTYDSVKEDVNRIAEANMPYVASNYFHYSYTENSAKVEGDATKQLNNKNQSKIVVSANLKEEARIYTIIVKDGNSVATKTGKYMQTTELTTTKSNPVWKDSSDQILATGSSYKARFVSSGNESVEIGGSDQDCQIIKLESQSGVSVEHKSVVSIAFTEKYYSDSGDTEMLSHNFYIIDYCAEGELLGGGVLYATTENGAYRQTNTETYLGAYASPTVQASITARTDFITGILNGDYSTEYKAQSINNVGFRYKPYKKTEDVFRYSDELHAYLTVFEGTNVNSPNYAGQKLRLFSFMVYKNGNNTVIVPSDGYAEVDRYKAG